MNFSKLGRWGGGSSVLGNLSERNVTLSTIDFGSLNFFLSSVVFTNVVYKISTCLSNLMNQDGEDFVPYTFCSWSATYKLCDLE